MIEGVGVWVLRFATDETVEALLVRRATDPYRGSWFTVDGMLEPGESPRTAALREMAEETSVRPSLLLADSETPAAVETVRGTVWLHGFVAFARAGSQVVLNEEHTDYAWFDVKTACDLVPLRSQRLSLDRAIERLATGSADGILDATDARQIPHPGGNLRDHLERTAALLQEFGSRAVLRTAGLLHAAYGTDGFERSLLRLEDRALLKAMIGKETEALVYRYAACDRKRFYSSLLAGRTDYRNRFDSTREALTAEDTRDLVELTFANELDIARHDESFRRQHEAELVELFQGCRRWASERAYACYIETLSNARTQA